MNNFAFGLQCISSTPEDQEHDDDGTFVESSLSVDEAIAWIADEASGAVADWSGNEDEGIDGFGREGSCRPTCFLKPFDSLFPISLGPDEMVLHRIACLRL